MLGCIIGSIVEWNSPGVIVGPFCCVSPGQGSTREANSRIGFADSTACVKASVKRMWIMYYVGIKEQGWEEVNIE